MSRRLDRQTAWITGAASGIGEATARLFADEGARVALIDVDADRGRAVERSIRSAGGEALFLPCDVASEDAVHTSIEQTVHQFGGLQVIVNSAGIVLARPLHDHTAEDWDRLMAINVRSIFFSMKHSLVHLRRNERSYMVNLGSISSFVGQAGTPAYTTSKFAVLGLSRSIALDYAAIGLRCNCVCPGITDTPLLRHHLQATPDPAATLAARLHRVPTGRALTPLDIARAVLYLSCDDSSGITGTSLTVDGGYIAAAEWETSHITLPSDLP
jgi:NAD(P)-dependent dehydrogenase (short-subunit alcohol dehydrogenase family)